MARPRTLADLPAIKDAKLAPGLERAVRSRKPPQTRKRKPPPKPKGVQKVKVRAPRTIDEAASAARVAKQVQAARKRPPKADTGDVRRGTRKPEKSQLKKELEGRGGIAKAFEKAGEGVLKQPHLKVATKVAGIIPGLGGLEERAVKDIVNLPAQAVPSVYVPVAAAVEAARGRPQRAEQFVRDIKESDPLVNLAMGKPGKALKLAKEHPGFTAAELVGVKGTVGRGVTRAQEATGKRPTRREPATLPGTPLKQPREYSRDVFTRRGQITRERAAAQRSQRLRAEAATLERQDPGKHAPRIAELRSQADQGPLRDPTRMKDTEVRKRAAERVAANEQMRRENRMKVASETQQALTIRKGKRVKVKPTAATTLHAQQIVDADPADLARYKAEVAREYEGLDAAGRKANRELQHEIQQAIDEGVDPAALREQAKRYAEVIRPRTQALVDRGMLPAASADKAPLVPYAVRRMGATYDPVEKLTEAGKQRKVGESLREQAERRVPPARRAEATAARQLALAHANARVSAAKRKTTPQLRAAESARRTALADVARIRRGQIGEARSSGRAQGRAELQVAKVDRRLLLEDDTYRRLSNANQKWSREKNKARRVLAAVKRSDRGYTQAQRMQAEARVQKAEAKSRETYTALKAREQALRKSKDLKTIVSTRPVRSLSALEHRRADEVFTLQRLADARKALAVAERRVADERKRIRGVAPERADRLQRAMEAREVARREVRREVDQAERLRRAHVAVKASTRGIPTKAVPGLVDPKGKPLRSKAIREHMQERGVPEPGYVSQSPQRAGAYFVSSSRPQSATGPTRTGSATKRGTFAAHPDVLAESAARAQGLIDAADGFAASIHEFAHKPTLGKLKTRVEADRQARRLSEETGVEFQPVRINPFAGRQEQLQALLDSAGEGGVEQPVGKVQPLREALEGAYRGEDGPGPWALIPKTAADEFTAHVQRMGVGPGAKTAQLVTQAFRRAVLSTSPTWFAGNLIEASLRSTLAGAGPRSHRLGKDVLARVDELSPKLGHELRTRAVGGGHFRSADVLHVRRGAEQFQGTQLQGIAQALHKFWQTPGPKQAARAWQGWTDLVFRQVNGRIESAYQTAMLGRALRSSPLMPQNVPALSAKAVDQAARGLLDTNEQAALARQVERMYGKYNGFTAGTRWAIAMYTPFVPWMLNAVRFVYDVLPRDHPTVTGLIAMTEQATDEWRKERGLDLFITEAVPGFLQGSIPLEGGRHQRAPSRYLPFGAFGDPLETAGKAVLPQYQGILSAFKGEDWKGAKLRNEDGTEMDLFGKALKAAEAFTDATVPVVGIAKRVAQKGPQALNPLAPTAPPKTKVAAGRPGGDAVQKAIDAAIGGRSDPVQQAIDRALGGAAP